MLEKLQREYQITSTRAFQQREKISKIEKDLVYEKTILSDLERHMGILQESITGKGDSNAIKNDTEKTVQRDEGRETGDAKEEQPQKTFGSRRR